jgi:ribosomal protein L3 glutamine methyltransferase
MNAPASPTTVIQWIEAGAQQFEAAGLAYGHGTTNAFDEAAWLVLWKLGLPLDDLDAVAERTVSEQDAETLQALLQERIGTRKPAAYLTHEAWLQGVPFYVDERAIVPRSFIAELIADGSIDVWLGEHTKRVLDLCTGNGSLAILAAMAWPEVSVTGADISDDALAVARINVDRHQLQERVTLRHSDGMRAVRGPQDALYDLILCNPPYVNAQSMAALPAEYRAEPELALSGNLEGGSDGMDFIRHLLRDAAKHMSEQAVLVLEIGNERAYFEAAFPHLEAIWLETSAGIDQVLLLTRESLLK